MTTLVGGSEQAGNTLDVLAFRDIFVTSFDLHVVVNCFLPDILDRKSTRLNSSHVD